MLHFPILHRSGAMALALATLMAMPAAAETVMPANMLLSGDSGTNLEAELNACAMFQDDLSINIKACDVALARRDLKRHDRARLLHARSYAKVGVNDFRGALRDIEKAIKLLPGVAGQEAQQCWILAGLDENLDRAKLSCLKSLELGSPNYRLFDSLGLISFRKGEFQKAFTYYDIASFNGTWTPAVYGKLLSIKAYLALSDEQIALGKRSLQADGIGKVEELNDPAGLRQLFGGHLKVAESAFLKFSEKEQREARASFERFGLSETTVDAAARKIMAEHPLR
ncbi:hypothetical protein [Sphingomonas colocasiae]|uniref:Tetratricopeptide repeat protein n=1 Tax=Sphingomonas colocasiae TaxID=1848973 RepID=A0ABS7PQ06_9SPHN|nr:hypothetical protein [Sphingomonas colocasiae]MBY8823326.1 hypothetical protein [Sphingomonas colocasiae]MBY8826461.1 hypothetical protein [Sphingomonas colocasiae]